MASLTQEQEELLRHPLYVFDLPEKLLATLSTKITTHVALKEEIKPDNAYNTDFRDCKLTTSTSCSLCKVSFQNVEEQREHVQSDHHRFNLKAQLRGNTSLNEAEFNRAIGELDESISGSDLQSSSEDEDDSKAPDSTLVTLLKRQAKLSSPETCSTQNESKQPLLWFTSPLLSPNTFLGIYRGLFTNTQQNNTGSLVDSLRERQTRPLIHNSSKATIHPSNHPGTQPPSQIFLCMIGGGHFAAAIVSVTSEVHKKAGGIEDRKPVVVAHKTFHRYTTRRKQGGSQSANDSSKGAAHSAGSSLRRYNEAALEKEIRDLLDSWRHMIEASDFLFVRATGATNRRILFGPYDGQVLKKTDTRLRGFPFTTRRATHSELLRAFAELTRVKVSHVDEATLAREQVTHQAPVTKPAKPVSQKPKLSREEEEAILHTSQIQALIRRSKISALLSYLTSNGITSTFRLHSSELGSSHRCPTPLHLAASLNSPAIVVALLTKAGADPTILNDERRAAFELASDRPTRDAFRIARHELGEASWDWTAAHIPSAISKKDVEIQTEQDKKAAEEAEARRRKEALERIRREDAKSAAHRSPSGRKLVPIEKTPAEKREEETRGMTPEMKARLERERRARAAEERIRRMQTGPRP
ncbi:hypothetical protein LOZ65_000758 [Ophidiomyces ophidiicola]|nr:hypothetical protein LOZ65_000758 [Ophidiomyces ophidiicola]